jgi:RNA polymerase sigma factor (sigma-70 family)
MIVETKETGKLRKDSSIEDLYRLYHHKLVLFFGGKGLEREIAEDLSQEVFFRFLRSNASVESEDHARNLLYRIAQNLLIDHFRKHNGSVRVRALSPEGLADELPYLVMEEVGPEDSLIKDETSRDIRLAISRLPLRYAQAIMLKEYDDLSYREIAARMGVSPKAVESLLHRAKAQLKEDLAETGKSRGGWWSAIFLGLRGLKERAGMKPLRAIGHVGSRWHGASLGLGFAGVGKGALNLIAVVLLLGSVAGTGVAAATYFHRDEPAVERIVEDIAPAAEHEAAGEETVMEKSTGRDHTAVNEAELDEPIADTVTGMHPASVEDAFPDVGGLLDGTGVAARGAISSAGAGLDLLLADLGQILGALSDPLVGLLFYAGVPTGLLETLEDLASLEAARDLTEEVVCGAVEATYILDETADVLSSLPAIQPGGTGFPPEGSTEQNEVAVTPPGETPDDENAGEPAALMPDPDASRVEGETAAGSEEASEDDPNLVNDLLETVDDIVDSLLPF